MIDFEVKKHTLFGDRASRVTTVQMQIVFEEIKTLIGHCFDKMVLSRSLPSKETHGDIDIICLPKSDKAFQAAQQILKNHPTYINSSNNSYVHSFLMKTQNFIDNAVHIDLIHCPTEELFLSRYQYFAFNDFMGVFGIFSKQLGFSVGDAGMFRKYRDKRNNRHRFLLTYNLYEGMKYLGYGDDVAAKMDAINNVDDVIAFLLSSPMMDSSLFNEEHMNHSNRKSMKRPILNYIATAVLNAGKVPEITDHDYFLKQDKPVYDRVMSGIAEIENRTYIESKKYNGKFVMNVLGIETGKQVGVILKMLSDKFGENLENVGEEEVLEYLSHGG